MVEWSCLSYTTARTSTILKSEGFSAATITWEFIGLFMALNLSEVSGAFSGRFVRIVPQAHMPHAQQQH